MSLNATIENAINCYNSGQYDSGHHLLFNFLETETYTSEQHFKIAKTIFQFANEKMSVVVRAENEFRKLDDANPSAEAQFYIGNCLTYQGKTAQAILPFQEAISYNKSKRSLSDEQVGSIYFSLGKCYLTLDQPKEAERALEQAVRLLPLEKDAVKMLHEIKLGSNLRAKHKIARWPVDLSEFENLKKIAKEHAIVSMDGFSGLSRNTRVVAHGSCFAQNITSALKAYHVNAECFRFGEVVNSTFSNRAFLEWIFEEDSIDSDIDWSELHQLPPSYFRERYLAADLAVVTLGVAGAFFHKETGKFTVQSPATNTLHLLKNYEFRTTSTSENVENILRIIEIAKKHNENIQFIFTVSPVPLLCSFEYTSALLADCVSKSTLRVAIDEVMRMKIPGVFYFPAFEIIKWAGLYRGDVFGNEDGTSRHVSEYALQAVMSTFLDNFFIEN